MLIILQMKHKNQSDVGNRILRKLCPKEADNKQEGLQDRAQGTPVVTGKGLDLKRVAGQVRHEPV